MPIPRTRSDLVEMLESSWAKLQRELDEAGPRVGSLPCVDDWTVRDLLSVRAWWTESVVEWIEAGRRGEVFDLPAPGYSWKETPRLNADIVRRSRSQSLRRVRARLDAGYARARALIDTLDDRELLEPRAFAWAGKYPVARWLSLNTARQYTTARTFVRRALREGGC